MTLSPPRPRPPPPLPTLLHITKTEQFLRKQQLGPLQRSQARSGGRLLGADPAQRSRGQLSQLSGHKHQRLEAPLRRAADGGFEWCRRFWKRWAGGDGRNAAGWAAAAAAGGERGGGGLCVIVEI